MTAPHDHPQKDKDSAGSDAFVDVPLKVKFELDPDVPKGARIAAWVFDEDGASICHCAFQSGRGRLRLPRRVAGRMITIAIGAERASHTEPTLVSVESRGAHVVRALVPLELSAIDIGRVLIPGRWFRKSCCRVRGRVIRRIRLPNGHVIERPLCNARVVICEVDEKPWWVVARLPDDLLVRLAADLEAVGVPIPIPRPDPPVLAPDYRAVAVLESRDAFEEGTAAGHRLPLWSSGTHMEHARQNPPPGPAAKARGPQTAHGAEQAMHADVTAATEIVATAVRGVATGSALRAVLLEHIDLIRRHWCRFPWLHGRYSLDCVKTVNLDAAGRFDTDISYLCYGDRPDLYFKVEQGCGDDWRTVHAPGVACSTHWDYCCGDEVEIVVTGDAGLGAVIGARAHVFAAGDPASIGSWHTLPYNSQIFAVHAALMRTGKVLLFSGGVEHQLPLQSRIWDPITQTFQSHAFADDLFCAFQVVLDDGRVLVMGGSNYNGPHGRGIDVTYTFDPASPGWVKHANMAFGRWYPTAVMLPDGRVAVMSGRPASGPVVDRVEVFDPSTNTWNTRAASANKTIDIYPSLHLMANGKVFYTGTRWEGGSSSPRPWSPPDTALFDPTTDAWSDVGPHVIPNRTEGTSILLPPRARAMHHHGHGEEMPPPGTLSRVLVLGGDGGSLAERASAEIIDLDTRGPAWQRIADMHHRRVNPNAVLLPDGNVLVCAGINGFKWDPDPGRVLEAEIFDPQALTWQRAGVMAEGRQYHSVSLLLPDGRVLNTGSVGGSGGSVNLLSMEVFSPPYLFRGPRPKVTGYPTSATRGSTIRVTSPDACRIRRAALLRPGAPTHHTDSELRHVPLDFHRDGRCDLLMPVPESAAVLPPGYYMLFVVDDCDVPSVGVFIRIG